MTEFHVMPNESAVAQAMQLDRMFFEMHPNREDYCRLAIPGEDFGFFPPKVLVHMVNYGDGARSWTFYYPPEETWSDLEREATC